MKILVVDDEEKIRLIIREYLENNGYYVDEAESGMDALDKLKIHTYDLCILDIMMPKMDGFTMLKECPKDKRVPTIVLSARGDEYDKLSGFDLGIDDYVTKPFSPKELVARVKAVLHRSKNELFDIYEYNDLVINYSSHIVKLHNKALNLTPKEFVILSFLVQNKNIAISREQLLSNLWGYDFFGDDRTVDAHIKMLRNNLADYRNHIITVRGVGYKYVEDEE